MNQPLKLIIAEDNPADATLILRELRRAGFAPEVRRVDCEEDFLAALTPDLDVILSDFEMPQFSGNRALELLKLSGLSIPFIIVSGIIGEEAAVAIVKQGASDYLYKDRLARLGPAVTHALEESALRRDRRKALEELRLFRVLVEASADAFEIIDPQTGRFLDANKTAYNTLGYSREEFLALTVFDLDLSVSPESWAQDLDSIRSTGSKERNGSRRRRDGSVFPIEFSCQWVQLAQDRSYIVRVVRDITERKRSEARFRRLVDSSAQGVFFRKTSGEITGANDAFLHMLGRTRQELTDKNLNWITLTPPEHHAADQRCLEELAQKGVCTPYEKEYIHKDGHRVPVLVGVAAFEDAPDEAVCFVVDLTERKILEQQFLRAQRMESLGTLAGGIAHDLNNVLTPIIMGYDMLKLAFPDQNSQDLLNIVHSSARRGAEMVQQILAFARGLQGKRMEVQVKHLLKEIVKILNDTFLKHVEVTTSLPHDLWTVNADPTQLHQVLLNMSVNARDAMPEGGKLTISAENILVDAQYAISEPEAKPGQYVVIAIQDTGIGIRPDIIGKIFDPFFTTKEIGKGTGLGLSTSLGIVKSHGGFIRVKSQVGQGTEFKIWLPANLGGAPETKELASEMPRGHGELILVVDDEATVREITRQTLEAFGYRVLLARDGAEAISIYVDKGSEIALVLTDMRMPVMDGEATILVLRKINPDVLIIAAEGLGLEQGTKTAELGVKHFLKKPFTSATLLRILKETLPSDTLRKKKRTTDSRKQRRPAT